MDYQTALKIGFALYLNDHLLCRAGLSTLPSGLMGSLNLHEPSTNNESQHYFRLLGTEGETTKVISWFPKYPLQAGDRLRFVVISPPFDQPVQQHDTGLSFPEITPDTSVASVLNWGKTLAQNLPPEAGQVAVATEPLGFRIELNGKPLYQTDPAVGIAYRDCLLTVVSRPQAQAPRISLRVTESINPSPKREKPVNQPLQLGDQVDIFVESVMSDVAISD